jgi:beta-glucosidase
MYLRNGMLRQQPARAEGIPLKGNFVWTDGYSRRCGIVHVGFRTQKHIPTLSAQWFREAATRNAVV